MAPRAATQGQQALLDVLSASGAEPLPSPDQLERWQRAGIPLTEREWSGFGPPTSRPTDDAAGKVVALQRLLAAGHNLAQARLLLWAEGFEVAPKAVQESALSAIANLKRQTESQKGQSDPTKRSPLATAWRPRARDELAKRGEDSRKTRLLLEDALSARATAMLGKSPTEEGAEALFSASGIGDLLEMAEGAAATGMLDDVLLGLDLDAATDAIAKADATDLEWARAEMQEATEAAQKLDALPPTDVGYLAATLGSVLTLGRLGLL